MCCVPSAGALAGRCAVGQGFYIILPGGARCAASSAGRVSGCPCLIWGHIPATGATLRRFALYHTEKNRPPPICARESTSENPKSAPAEQTRIPPAKRKKQGTMRKNRTLSVATEENFRHSQAVRLCTQPFPTEKAPSQCENTPLYVLKSVFFVADRGPLQEDEHNIVT